MTLTTVAVDGDEALDVLLDFAAKIALDESRLKRHGDALDLVIDQFVGPLVGIHFGFLEDQFRGERANAIDVL